MEAKRTSELEKIKIEKVFEMLKSSETGLSSSEAINRRKKYGYNEVAEKKPNALMELFLHFWNPVGWFLGTAALLAYLIGETGDAGVLLFLLLMNGSIGYYNDHDSQKALELLKKELTIKTRVLRDQTWIESEARELVPGDIISVGLGNVIPADAKIISGETSVDQSAITGESLPIKTGLGDILYTGSVIKRGEAKCIVVNTGLRTFYGKTVELVNIAKPRSRQQEIMFSVSKNLIIVGAIGFIVILSYSLYAKIPWITIATFAIIFIGGGVPAALPVMFTISQAKGASELSKKSVLVTRLDAMENAASVEIICMDKTGTLTENRLQVRETIPFFGFNQKDVILISALASSKESKDAIDNCILSHAKDELVETDGYLQLSFTPFEPATKRTESEILFKDEKFSVMKGAPQTVLGLCQGINAEERGMVEETVHQLSKKGFRALGVATTMNSKQGELSFVGLIALGDPIRPDTSETIAQLKKAGIKPLMLTGDNIEVAREIAEQAGIGKKIVRISEINSLPEDEQAEALLSCDGVAEIYPEDKFWAVKLLQSKNKMVGMTGDGVNDAPALKLSEMGIAVSNSADVAKAAASMVIVKPGTHTILEAVKISREIYQRMLTWTLNKISITVQIFLLLSIGLFWFMDVIVSIAGLFIMFIASDFLTMSLAADNVKSTKNPNAWNVKNITIASLFVGLLFTLMEVFIIYAGTNWFALAFDNLKTLVLLSLVYTSQFSVILVRERRHFWESKPAKYLLITIIITMIIFTLFSLFGVVIDPIPANAVAFSFLTCVVTMILIDLPKSVIFKKLGL